MATDRGRDAIVGLTPQQVVESVLSALRATARDIDERRVPLDGRVRPECYAAEQGPSTAVLAPVTAK
jgi:hypothetical protein